MEERWRPPWWPVPMVEQVGAIERLTRSIAPTVVVLIFRGRMGFKPRDQVDASSSLAFFKTSALTLSGIERRERGRRVFSSWCAACSLRCSGNSQAQAEAGVAN